MRNKKKKKNLKSKKLKKLGVQLKNIQNIANKVYKTGKDGVIAGCYLLFYSIGRFLIEFLRSDPRGDVGILSTSQFISLFIFAAGVGMVLFFGLRKEKNAEIAKAETKDVTE